MEIRIPLSASQIACFVAGLCFGVNAHAEPPKPKPIYDLPSMCAGSSDACLNNIEKRTTASYLMIQALYSAKFDWYYRPKMDGSKAPPLF